MKRYPASKPMLGSDECGALMHALASGQITQGERVAAFERGLSLRLCIPHVTACSSGTAALHLALAALGIGFGDEVIIPDLSFIATANAVLYCGATPVFADIDPTTWCIDPNKVEQLITSRTRAIIAVHLYGVPCELEQLSAIASRSGLYLVEDAAEGLGGFYNNETPLGTYGDIGTFSFYGNKVITTGEGGAVVTNSREIDTRVRLLRGQSQSSRRFYHTELGFNYRMTDLHAAIGLAQLERWDYIVECRHAVCRRYRVNLKNHLDYPNVDGIAPWFFTGLVPTGVDRDVLMLELDMLDIETRPTFVPMHEMPYLKDSDSCPVSVDVSKRGISLPTYPELSRSDVDIISLAVTTVLERMQENAGQTRSVGQNA